jgi:hypothetical protein
MAINAQLTEMTSVTGYRCQDASVGRYRARTSVLAFTAAKDYRDLFERPTGDTMPS